MERRPYVSRMWIYGRLKPGPRLSTKRVGTGGEALPLYIFNSWFFFAKWSTVSPLVCQRMCNFNVETQLKSRIKATTAFQTGRQNYSDNSRSILIKKIPVWNRGSAGFLLQGESCPENIMTQPCKGSVSPDFEPSDDLIFSVASSI